MFEGNGNGGKRSAKEIASDVSENVWLKLAGRASMIACAMVGMIFSIFLIPDYVDVHSRLSHSSERLLQIEQSRIERNAALQKTFDSIDRNLTELKTITASLTIGQAVGKQIDDDHERRIRILERHP